MFSLVVAGLLLSVPVGVSEEPIAPGDGLVLSPTPVVRSPVRLPTERSRPTAPPIAVAVGAIAVTGAGVMSRARSKKDEEPFFVLVHGSGGSADDFDQLLAKLGVPGDQVAVFDYRAVAAGNSSTEASRTASTERAAEALDKFIRELAREHGNIYSIHHSRGGAVGVTMIGALDDGTRPRIPGYVGAALLDPAIGAGWLGSLQRMGGVSSLVPDNGGFNVERCTDGSCRDVRENLGDASGVEVIAIRNLDAEFMNFRDEPPGLRVLDLIYDGGIPARYFLPISPIIAFSRAWQAHTSVLRHDAVADCIAAEVAEAGSCSWDDGRRADPVWRGGGGGGGGGGHVILE